MAQQQFITDELNQLQKDIISKNPSDILQFCANYFNTKLQSQRSQLWSQQHKAKAAGINLFPDVENVNINSFGSGVVLDRQPSFKSPFGDNDPHSNHNDDDPHGPGAAGAPESSTSNKAGLFKNNFDVSHQAPQKHDHDVDPSDSTTTSGSSFPGKSTGPFAKGLSKIPIAFNANRRTSVSAEALNPDKFKSDSWKPPTNNLTSSQRADLSKTLASNFLFQQLDGTSKKTVIEALSPKTFSKDTEIITQGDEGDYFYIIEKGTVDFYVNGSKVNSSNEGSSFGELALMYNSPRAATAVAATDVTCWALDRLTFRRILLEGTFNRRLMYEDFLKDVEVLKSLSSHERSKLADALSTEIYEKGDKIVTEGEQGENFYFIESGSCQVYNNQSGVIKQLTKGDYFGEIALLNDKPRQATVEALDHVIVATLGKAGFQRLLGPAVEVLKSNDPTAPRTHENASASQHPTSVAASK
ncbi:camp-dependent protein kinase regulatory subunit [Suhomyces tanzawaensis NRRL Y-17324]|uniref:cAMP-dependent protein kinase regulatory subunit n=1 Tax=Suhomyces tanzawaensis NRRL Y-17324 TaxID=984487 RepID=A0A1E4SJM8_9ASCO|nr:camp-dependent protein kinase regulatory subunit [Suhomyces tanzawaensis NRRL Y-17324]ODV79698.1 camp-dependent protein kinase regulatory subunit [Suhomyces tanzawaensis NRRL Y-17324]